ncbi:UNVERIFIED_CONTAM: hypothetical protein FKN15_056078 [Acipenser sinensis]
MILGDLGAEVIKVERPGVGDDTRAWGPPFVGKESAYFLSVNRNKKSIAVNLKDPKGATIIKELASVCDVFIENYIPGKLGEMGLGYEDIKKVAPQIVYCSITGYGQTGPMSHRAGYDSIACAVSGLMHITGPQDGDPVRPGVAMTDLATGLYTHGAIMAGLLQRHKTGRGQHIDCNLLSSQVACLTHIAANYLNGQKEAKRWGTAHESIVPYQSHKLTAGQVFDLPPLLNESFGGSGILHKASQTVLGALTPRTENSTSHKSGRRFETAIPIESKGWKTADNKDNAGNQQADLHLKITISLLRADAIQCVLQAKYSLLSLELQIQRAATFINNKDGLLC